MSRLDYCNSVLAAGFPQSTLYPLQRVQNAAARLNCDVPRHKHITPHLRELHWLPVLLRIQYLCLMIYNVHNGRCPSYLIDMMQFADTPSRPLRRRSCRFVELCQVATSDEIRKTGVFIFWSSGMESTPSCRLSLLSSENLKQSCFHVAPGHILTV